MFTTNGADELVTPAEAAPVLGVTPALIRKWASTNKIQAAGLNRSGHKVYRYLDLARYEHQTRRAAGRRHEPSAGVRTESVDQVTPSKGEKQ